MICRSPAAYPIETAVPALIGIAPTEFEQDAGALAAEVPTTDPVADPVPAGELDPDSDAVDPAEAEPDAVDPAEAELDAGDAVITEPDAELRTDPDNGLGHCGPPLSRICTDAAALVDTLVRVSSEVPLLAMINCSAASLPFAQVVWSGAAMATPRSPIAPTVA
jgi:hypothetical protein